MEVNEHTGPPNAARPGGINGRNHDGVGVIEFAVAWERETRFVEKHLSLLIAP